jgi:hypothetical protein
MKNFYQKRGGVSKQDRLLPKPEDAALSLGKEQAHLQIRTRHYNLFRNLPPE